MAGSSVRNPCCTMRNSGQPPRSSPPQRLPSGCQCWSAIDTRLWGGAMMEFVPFVLPAQRSMRGQPGYFGSSERRAPAPPAQPRRAQRHHAAPARRTGQPARGAQEVRSTVHASMVAALTCGADERRCCGEAEGSCARGARTCWIPCAWWARAPSCITHGAHCVVRTPAVPLHLPMAARTGPRQPAGCRTSAGCRNDHQAAVRAGAAHAPEPRSSTRAVPGGYCQSLLMYSQPALLTARRTGRCARAGAAARRRGAAAGRV